MEWPKGGLEAEELRLIEVAVEQDQQTFTTSDQICFCVESMHSTHSHSRNSFHFLRLCVAQEVVRRVNKVLEQWRGRREVQSQKQNLPQRNHNQRVVQLTTPKEVVVMSEGARSSSNVLGKSWL